MSRPHKKTVRRLVLDGALEAKAEHSEADIKLAYRRINIGIESLIRRSFYAGRRGRPTNREGWLEWVGLQGVAQSPDSRILGGLGR